MSIRSFTLRMMCVFALSLGLFAVSAAVTPDTAQAQSKRTQTKKTRKVVKKAVKRQVRRERAAAPKGRARRPVRTERVVVTNQPRRRRTKVVVVTDPPPRRHRRAHRPPRTRDRNPPVVVDIDVDLGTPEPTYEPDYEPTYEPDYEDTYDDGRKTYVTEYPR